MSPRSVLIQPVILHVDTMVGNKSEGLLQACISSNYNNRKKDSIRKNKGKTKWGSINSFNSALDEWNISPMEIGTIETRNCFKKAILDDLWKHNVLL